jgi:hypothetical protein
LALGDLGYASAVRVALVFAGRHPLEILGPVVMLDTVLMVDLWLFGFSQECFRYQAMNIQGLPLSILKEHDIWVATVVD